MGTADVSWDTDQSPRLSMSPHAHAPLGFRVGETQHQTLVRGGVHHAGHGLGGHLVPDRVTADQRGQGAALDGNFLHRQRLGRADGGFQRRQAVQGLVVVSRDQGHAGRGEGAPVPVPGVGHRLPQPRAVVVVEGHELAGRAHASKAGFVVKND